MDKEQIAKLEEIVKNHLFGKVNNTDYELKKIDVIVKYLIYKQLEELNLTLNSRFAADQLAAIKEKLESIDETLADMANAGIWEK